MSCWAKHSIRIGCFHRHPHQFSMAYKEKRLQQYRTAIQRVNIYCKTVNTVFNIYSNTVTLPCEFYSKKLL